MRPLAAPLVALALVAGGCGGSSSSGPQTPFPAPASQGQPPGRGPGGAQFQAFASCLRDQGVDLPDPGQGGPPGGTPPSGQSSGGFDPSDPIVRKAFQACRDKLPQGAGPNGAPPGQPGTG